MRSSSDLAFMLVSVVSVPVGIGVPGRGGNWISDLGDEMRAKSYDASE